MIIAVNDIPLLKGERGGSARGHCRDKAPKKTGNSRRFQGFSVFYALAMRCSLVIGTNYHLHRNLLSAFFVVAIAPVP